MIPLAIRWDVSPFIFEFGNTGLRWYSLLFAIGFVIGYFMVCAYAKRDGLPISKITALIWYMVIGTLVGARLGHCFFYEPAYYLAHPVELLFFWEGGLASHGAAIGIVLAVWLYSRIHKVSLLWTLDKLVIPVALTACLIRIGNLMNSEILGTSTLSMWGFEFVNNPYWLRAPYYGVPCHPVQLYEAFAYLCVFLLLYGVDKKKKGQLNSGYLLGLFLVTTFVARFALEFLKAYQIIAEQTLTLRMGQYLSIPCILIGIYLLFTAKKRGINPPHPVILSTENHENCPTC